ncbi:MAG: hypothetical protein H7A25_22925 [Leptospiraceae bacterium]|nr:hypothetical protein [Leptospiraceae bacterium]
MKQDVLCIPGYIIYKFKKMQIISPSDLRNNSIRNYKDKSPSFKFFLKELEESLIENSFDLKKYEEAKLKAKTMYEMVIGYSNSDHVELDDSDIIVIEKTDDLVKRYSDILLMKKDSHIYCKEAFLELVKEASDKIIMK